MIKQSSILKWTHNNRHNHRTAGREWLHPPDTLQRGHIAYLVKFLGNTEVEQAKGIEVVKEGIRKLKFTSQIRKSEGAKPPKVELTISIDGVAIQEPKTKRILHQYPLHRISYCADDKSEKKFFSFIAKEADSDKHMCFVFVSDKLAEEITLTIGQAFDLAYRRFLETSNRDLEMRKQLMILQQKIQALEDENMNLKQRIMDLQQLVDKQDIETYKLKNNIIDLCVVNGNDHTNQADELKTNNTSPVSFPNSPPPAIPPRSTQPKEQTLSPSQELFNELGSTLPVVGTKLENLVLEDFDDFNPRANGNDTPLSPPVNGMLAPVPCIKPPPFTNGNNHSNVNLNNTQLSDQGRDLFGAEPFVPCASVPANLMTPAEDPFGMGDFGQVPSHLGAQELETAIGDLDKRISEMRDGFSRGISFGNDDFSLESLDPLTNKPSN